MESKLLLETLRGKSSDLKGELCTAEVGLLFLPEVVRFDDERHTDLSREELLQGLQQRLDQLPLRAPHINDDCESTFTHILTERGQKRGTTERDN